MIKQINYLQNPNLSRIDSHLEQVDSLVSAV